MEITCSGNNATNCYYRLINWIICNHSALPDRLTDTVRTPNRYPRDHRSKHAYDDGARFVQLNPHNQLTLVAHEAPQHR